MGKLTKMLTVSLCLLVLSANLSFAQTGKQSNQYQIKSLSPDSSKNEARKIQEFFQNKLLRENITYKDGSLLVREFRAEDGSLKSEIQTNSKGVAKTCIYCQDGKTLSSVTSISGGDVETVTYRKDGKTVWTKTSDTKSGRVLEYFDDKGKLRKSRQFDANRLRMLVTVFDDAGKIAYKQTWASRGRGYLLIEICEPTANGEQKVIHLRGSRVLSVNYLNSDGAILRSIAGANFAETIPAERLKEFNAKDDPTIPKAPPSGIRFDARPRNAPIRR